MFYERILEMLTKNQIKLIISLHQKKQRDALGMFLVEGEKIVDELLKTDFEIIYLIALESWLHDTEIPIHIVNEEVLNQLSCLQTPNKVIAIVKTPLNTQNIYTENLYLFLDEIKDPGNLGAILRSAEWFGLKQIYCSPQCVEVWNPKVIQASMGSIFRIKFHILELNNLIHAVNPSKVYGATIHTDDITKTTLLKNAVLVIGSESHGIAEINKKLINTSISIPAYGATESLNAAIATSILLYEFNRQFSID